MTPWRAAALALALAGCWPADCLAPSLSPERQEFRSRLRALVYVYQCPGPPSPRALSDRVLAYHQRKQALLARIDQSRLRDDLQQAFREAEETSRNVFEAECATYSEEYGETPRGRAEFEAGLRGDEAGLGEVEARFERLMERCG